MSMWTRMFPICVSSSLYSVKLCYRPSTKLPSSFILLSRTSFRWCFFTRWGNFQAHWLASLRASVIMHRWVPKQYHGVMNKPRQSQILISTCWDCAWQMLFSNLVNRTKACFHMCIVFVCVISLEWFKQKFWIFTGLTPFRVRCFSLLAAGVRHPDHDIPSWQYNSLVLSIPLSHRVRIRNRLCSYQCVITNCLSNGLKFLKSMLFKKNWGNCTPHHPMFAFVSVICSTLRSMEMASVIGLVFILRIRSIEVGHNWSPFHTMALRFLSLQQHLLTLGACPR